MMNRDKRNIPKLNSIDILIITFLAIGLFIIIFKTFDLNSEPSPLRLDEYEVGFVANNVRSSSVEYFIEGQVFKTKSGNKTIGTLLKKPLHSPAVGEYTENGEIFYPDVESHDIYEVTRYDLKGTFSAVGEMTDRGLLLESGEYLLLGKELLIISELVEVEIRITSIERR